LRPQADGGLKGDAHSTQSRSSEMRRSLVNHPESPPSQAARVFHQRCYAHRVPWPCAPLLLAQTEPHALRVECVHIEENFAPLWNAAMHVKVAFVVFTAHDATGPPIFPPLDAGGVRV